MYSLVYTSVSTTPMSGSELHALLAEARTDNARRGVTGMLLYKQGNFLQVLEGDRPVVTELSERIARDRRHTRVFTLHEGEVDERRFPDWSMGFRDLDHDPTADISGFSDLMAMDLTPGAPGGKSERAYRLLRAFRDS